MEKEKNDYIQAINEFINEGEELKLTYNSITSRVLRIETLNKTLFTEWKIKCKNFINKTFGSDSDYYNDFVESARIARLDNVERGIGVLLGIKDYLVNFMKKIDLLICEGKKLLTKNKKIGDMAIVAGELNNELFIAWNTGCKAFLATLDNQEYSKSFIKNVDNPKPQDVKNGLEILDNLKRGINFNKKTKEIKHGPVSVFIGDQIIDSPGAKAKNTGNMANGSQNVKQAQGDENYWIIIIIEVVVGLLVVYLAYKFGWNK